MGSLKRKIRSLKDGHSTLADVPELVAHAREKKNLPPIPQNLTRRIVHGWEVFLSSFDHEQADGSTAEHWHCSCKLWPHGRPSDEGDWKMLGRLTHAVAVATGMPNDSAVRALTDIATADPSAAHHYIWHTDGSDCVVIRPAN